MNEDTGQLISGARGRLRWRTVLDVCTSIAVIVAASTLVWKAVGARLAAPQTRSEAAIPSQPLLIDGAIIKGTPQTAKVAMLEFADFQCPFCAKFAQFTLPDLIAGYVDRGDLVIAFRNNPLPIHPLARRAAQVSECASSQNAFWRLHDQFFSKPESLQDPIGAAGTVGIDLAQLRHCLDTDADSRIRADLSMAAAVGAEGTPDFFIGQFVRPNKIQVTARIQGAQPNVKFIEAIEKVVKKAAD